MGKVNLAALIGAIIALTGCGSGRSAADASGKTVAVASDPPIAKGRVKDGLYVNQAGGSPMNGDRSPNR